MMAVAYLSDGGYYDAPIISNQEWTYPYALDQYHKTEKDEHGNDTDPATVYLYGSP